VVFNVAYSTAPKAVLLTCADSDCANNEVYVNNRTTGEFEIAFATALGTSEVVELMWWAVE
jgi:hypothetical protein